MKISSMIPEDSADEDTPLSPSSRSNQIMKRGRIRRGSEPVNVNRRASTLKNSNNKSIEIIPEENEDEPEFISDENEIDIS